MTALKSHTKSQPKKGKKKTMNLDADEDEEEENDAFEQKEKTAYTALDKSLSHCQAHPGKACKINRTGQHILLTFQ